MEMLLATGNAWKSLLLGGLINQNLKWTEHILLSEESLVKKLGTRLNALKQIGKVADFKTRKMFADGLFMSKLIYLIPLWGGCEKFLIKALQILQNKAARSVTRLGIYTPVKTLLNQCGWLSVHQLVFFHTVVLLYKTLQSGSPEYLFSMTGRDYIYKTRAKDAGKLRIVPEYKLDHDLNLKSFRWRSIRSWNHLPLNITSITSLDKFKVQLKAWVKNNIDIYP